MIARINEHNELNGVVFSVSEFVLVAGAAAFVAVEFGLHGQTLGVVVAMGVVVNSLVVVALGVAAWSRGVRGTPIARVFGAGHRAELAREHPGLMRDTLIVAATVLAPFALTLLATIEWWRRKHATD